MTRAVHSDPGTRLDHSARRPPALSLPEDPMTALAAAHPPVAMSRPSSAPPVRGQGRPGQESLLHGPARRPSALPGTEELVRRAAAEQGREELRRARSLVAVVAVACVEVEAGRRPLRDLAGWLSPEVYDKVARRLELLASSPATRGTGTPPPRPVGARVCEVAPGRIEASATVFTDGRARAFALRLERRLSRWKVTTVEMG